MRKSFTLLAALVATSFANDARINALGSSEMFRDAADIFNNPAYVSQYKIIEGNITSFNNTAAGEEVVGSALATWHVTDKLILGGYYQLNDKFIRSPLFNDSKASPDRKSVPHALVGIKFNDKVTLGFDGSFEGSINKSETDGRKLKQRTTVIGLKVGTTIDLKKVDMDFGVGILLPSSDSTDSKFTTGTSTKDTTFAHNTGFGLDADARVTINLQSDLRLRTGATFGLETIKDKVAEKPNDEHDINILLMAGVAKDFEHNMTLGFDAQFGQYVEKYTESDDKTTTRGAIFTAAAEKTFGQTKLFDTHSFRVGYSHGFARTGEVKDNGTAPKTESHGTGKWFDGGDSTMVRTDVGLTLGTGVTRGKFGLDLYVSNVNFDFSGTQAGIWNLIPVAGATMTMDFGKKGTTLRSGEEVKYYGNSGSSAKAAPAAAPAKPKAK